MNQAAIIIPEQERHQHVQSMNVNEFEQLAQQHLKPLYSYCLSLTCDPHRAEELAQETLVRAYQNFSTLKDPGKFSAWLRGIARRCSWTWWRNAKHNPADQRGNPAGSGIPPDLAGNCETPAEEMQKRERNHEVLQALKRLSKRNREVVVLRYFEELSYADIALRLGISIDAVDQRLTRAKLKLRNILQYAEI